MSAITAAHVSVSRGALPFVVPTHVHQRPDGSLVLDSEHPTVVRGAQRGDIAAVQVDAPQQRIRTLVPGVCSEGSAADDTTVWSLTATGPLSFHDGTAVLERGELMVNVECLSSRHGHLIDPLLRSGLTST